MTQTWLKSTFNYWGKMLKALFLFLFVVLSVNAESFTECVKLFKNEEFFKAKKCFSSLKDKSTQPYKTYYLNLIAEVLDEKTTPIKEKTAIASYYYLYLAAKEFYKNDFERAKKFLKKVDEKALDKDDIPFYLYLKAFTENNQNLKKTLATKYIYDRNYGYKTFLQTYRTLSQDELWQAVRTLIRKRMYQRALGILPLIKDSDKKSYYLIYLSIKTKKRQSIENLLSNMDKTSKWYPVALYILGMYERDWKKRREYFKKLLETGSKKYISKLATASLKKAFHYRKFYEFNYYINQPADRKVKAWYQFLYLYFEKGKSKAFSYLTKKKKLISDKNKLNYWLYLSSGNKTFLKKVKGSKNDDFYKILAGGSVKKASLKDPEGKIDNILKLIKILKSSDLTYRWAYLEARYYLKNHPKKLWKLYSVMPEAVVRYVPYRYRFIKPFKEKSNLVYSFMKQESLFYYKAISFSNAVGLMQFIPSTAYWAAKKQGIKDFDITHLFRPTVSISFGKWYINYLLKRFDGNLYYTIAAYNGGEGNVRRTIKRFNPKNIAEFVETHPFDETRNYLKKVYTNFVIYNKTYGR